MIARGAGWLLLALCVGGASGQENPLAGAKAIADRGEWGCAIEVPQVLDGKPETNWNSGAMDLRVSPANLFLRLPEPRAIGTLEIQTVVSKTFLRLTDVEVYAPVGEGWALLAEAKGNRLETISLPLGAVVTDCLRIRLRDNLHPEHCWGVIADLRASAPAAGTPATRLSAAPVPDQSLGEQRFVDAALDRTPTYPRAGYDAAKGYLSYVRAFLDTLLERGTDHYGATSSPMFVSLLLLDNKEHPRSVMPTMPGQRIGDRAMFGGNLQHDLPLLLAMRQLSGLTGEPRYARAAEDYLRFFMTHCTNTPTGLWPWGEHGHWDFFADQTGHYLHEYLGAPPFELLDLAWEMRPEAVLGEARGLLNHVHNFEDYTFCRHADYTKPLADPRPKDLQALDFPRHGGMFVRHWAYAWSKSKEPRFLDWAEGLIGHFELTLRDDGFLPTLSKYAYRQALAAAPGSNLSVGISLLEAAPLMADTPAGAHAERLGRALLEAVAGLPLKPVKPGFAMAYGSSEFSGSDALLRLQAYRLTEDARHLAAARACAEAYATVDQTPTEGHIRAMVYGVLINLYLDLAELDPNPGWLPAAQRYARLGIEDLYHDGLFRGASNLGYYDSELFVSTFVYGLVRLEAQARKVNVPPLYYHR